MAELGFQADPNDAQEQSFDPVPAGSYPVIIEDSDYVDNKKQNGKMVKLTYQIIDGPFKGKKLFENLNLENPNDQAVQIARRTLNAICVAVGVPHVQDTAQLHNIPLMVEVKMKDSPEYGMQNVIKKHLAIDGSAPSAPAPAAAPASKSAAPAKGATVGKKKQPWEK
jgi:hypothetical protein